MLAKCREIGPRDVTREDLLLVHEARYLDLAEKEIRGGSEQLSTGDTDVCPESWEAARRGAGWGRVIAALVGRVATRGGRAGSR